MNQKKNFINKVPSSMQFTFHMSRGLNLVFKVPTASLKEVYNIMMDKRQTPYHFPTCLLVRLCLNVLTFFSQCFDGLTLCAQ